MISRNFLIFKVTWCYQVMSSSGGEDQYCATGFPMGCYVDKDGKQKDACVISRDYSKPDTFYIFNHVDITIYYHPKEGEDWGKYLATDDAGGRIVCKFWHIFRQNTFSRKKSLICSHQIGATFN